MVSMAQIKNVEKRQNNYPLLHLSSRQQPSLNTEASSLRKISKYNLIQNSLLEKVYFTISRRRYIIAV